MRVLVGLITSSFIIACAAQAAGQNIVQDYIKNVPSPYKPPDPWVRGIVFRNHIGHGGLFYNCDHQEDKRYSRWIYWQSQPRPCVPIHGSISQQIKEVKQRIRWGASAGVPDIPPPYAAPVESNIIEGAAPGARDGTSYSPRQPSLSKRQSSPVQRFRTQLNRSAKTSHARNVARSSDPAMAKQKGSSYGMGLSDLLNRREATPLTETRTAEAKESATKR